jgi:3-phosphoshikimate 1-carboxyvinyltransferase
MTVQISPSNINGILQVPASKSSMQRACAAALLHNGKTVLHNAGISNDDKAALSIITALGANISVENNTTIIHSNGFQKDTIIKPTTINCGESGLSIRMFTPIAAIASEPIIITGEGSLPTRPMNFFDEIFPQLNIKINSTDGKLPLQITGPLATNNISIDGSLSSQFLTGLLFAFGNTVISEQTIIVNNLKSKPYIDLTLHVMQHFGFIISHNNHEVFTILPKSKNIEHTINYTVESDWSSASFLLVAGVIKGNLILKGLDINSTQADKAILVALKLAGANININQDAIALNKSNLNAFEFDATECPDLFPPLVALAAYCKGTSIIKGTHRLAAKESDRAKALQDIFSKMGITIIVENDCMHITGAAINGATVSSHHDHRIAMAAAIAALGATGSIAITNADAINKSYPQFFEHLQQLGVMVQHIKS